MQVTRYNQRLSATKELQDKSQCNIIAAVMILMTASYHKTTFNEHVYSPEN